MNESAFGAQAYLEDLIAEGYRHLPICRELVADFETPLSCYVKVARGPYSYLLESANQGGEKWSRYSIIGLPARRVVRISGYELTLFDQGQVIRSERIEDPLAEIEQLQATFSYPARAGMPKYTGGLVGYFGYDTVRYVEPKIRHTTPTDDLGTDDIVLMISDDVIVFDNVKGRMHLITHVQDASEEAMLQAGLRLDAMEGALLAEIPEALSRPQVSPALVATDFETSYPEDAFKAAVESLKDFILAGDCMQVILSQRLSCGFEADPLNLYRALRALNPSPYMYFMDLESEQIVSSSPEILARLEQGEVTVRPLAGTRRRGRSAEDDAAMEAELLSDPKELAEHLMLIDLGRNDIGRVCEPGSVEVSDMMSIERYAHVMHIASNVTGRLRAGLSCIDVLRATLPVGTLSGAPKVRALELIDQFEPVKRGIFGGAVGYLSWQGQMDTAIAIRTAVIKDGRLYVQAGAGVVADSSPALEWKETQNKAQSVIEAAMIAENGLRFNDDPTSNR